MIYDINLIPKNRKKSSGGGQFILALLLISCTVMIGVFGFYLPYRDKDMMNNIIKEQKKEIKNLSEVQHTYTKLLEERDNLIQTNVMLDTLKNTKLDINKVMEDVETRVPEHITVREISLDAGLLTLGGTSPSYTDIASFIVKLREIEGVIEVDFMNAVIEDGVSNSSEDSSKPMNKFAVYVRLDSRDVLTRLIQERADMLSTAVQGVVNNETNE